MNGRRHRISQFLSCLTLGTSTTGIKDRFLTIANDTPEVRNIFERFPVEEVELKYSISSNEGSRSQARTELLIRN